MSSYIHAPSSLTLEKPLPHKKTHFQYGLHNIVSTEIVDISI